MEHQKAQRFATMNRARIGPIEEDMDTNFTDGSMSAPLRVKIIAPAGTPTISDGPTGGTQDWNDGAAGGTGLRVKVIAPAGTPLLPAGAPVFPEAANESLRVKVIAPAGTSMYGENE
jgi:hypothetical protein